MTDAPNKPGSLGPNLTSSQYGTLETVSRETCRLYALRPDLIRHYTDDGYRLSMDDYRALATYRLVDRDTNTSLHRGQKITVTERGRQALAGPRSAATAATPAKAAPKPPTAGPRR